MTLPDKSMETGQAEAAARAAQTEQDRRVDWKAIQAVTGYNDEQIATIKAQWAYEQPWGDKLQGVIWEREARLILSDRPGGLTEHAGGTPVYRPEI